MTGYLLAVILEFVANVHLYCFFADMVVFGISGFLICQSMVEDVKNNFDSINGTVKTKGTSMEFHKKIAHSVELHFNIKKFSEMKTKFWKEIFLVTNASCFIF